MKHKPGPAYRPPSHVLGLSIVTLGIYLIVYLFSTIRSMEKNFSYGKKDIQPRKTRKLLIIYLIAAVAVAIVAVNVRDQMAAYVFGPPPSHYYAIVFAIVVVQTAIFLLFWMTFLRLLETTHRTAGITPSKVPVLLRAVVVIAVLRIAAGYIPPGGLLLLFIDLCFIYLVITEINKIRIPAEEAKHVSRDAIAEKLMDVTERLLGYLDTPDTKKILKREGVILLKFVIVYAAGGLMMFLYVNVIKFRVVGFVAACLALAGYIGYIVYVICRVFIWLTRTKKVNKLILSYAKKYVDIVSKYPETKKRRQR